jgi:lambda repressor-like predicted transcriptional regulator
VKRANKSEIQAMLVSILSRLKHSLRLISLQARLVIKTSKFGYSLSQISEQTWLSIDEIKETLGQFTGLTPKSVGIIFDMKQTGLSLEQISQETDVELETLRQFLTDSKKTPPTTTEDTKLPHPPKPQHTPTFFYSCQDNTNCTGSISSLENSPSIKCLITGSRVAVVGVSCQEEVYSSLVEF